jgi:hypothetical protein
MLYIYAVQRALPQYRDFRIAGEIVYPNRTVRVLQGGLPASFITDLGASCWPFLGCLRQFHDGPAADRKFPGYTRYGGATPTGHAP